MLQAVAVPRSLSEAHVALGDGVNTRIIGGGTVVMPELALGTDAFDRLVSLRHAGFDPIHLEAGTAQIGAMATLAALERSEPLAFLRPALSAIASPTVRNLATIGGNLFAARPYGDLAACLIALDATATISGGRTTRQLPVETLVAEGIAPGEIVTAIAFDLPSPGSFRFLKASRRALNSAAIITIAAVLAVEGGRVVGARLALGGVAPTPIRARPVEAALVGRPLDRDSADSASRHVADLVDPEDDAYASAWYRRRVAPVYVRRAIAGA